MRIRLIILSLLIVFVRQLLAQLSSERSIEQANELLWNNFIDEYGIVNDFVGERPTQFDCKLSRPNAFGWWTPIEDGAFFTGLYLKAACERAKITNKEADKDKARILAQGLLKLASISDVPGFISRGVSTDGTTHYPIGSNDQTVPWFYGLYTYLKTDLPSEREKEIIRNKLIEVIDAVRLNDWEFPDDGMFTGQNRDNLLDNRFLEVPCYLFLLRAMYELTDDQAWLDWYHRAIKEYPEGSTMSRAEICMEGIKYDLKMWGERGDYLWIYVMKQEALVELTKMEKDLSIKSHFVKGIDRNREFVMQFINEYTKFDNENTEVFGNANWRECYPHWFPQFNKEDAIELSRMGVKEKIGTRKKYERLFMTTPLAAASIIALANNSADNDLIKQVIGHYDYSKLYLSEFFYAEFAFYSMGTGK